MWYTHPLFSIALGGILPFGAVCIELFFIMSALWLHQIYYVFGEEGAAERGPWPIIDSPSSSPPLTVAAVVLLCVPCLPARVPDVRVLHPHRHVRRDHHRHVLLPGQTTTTPSFFLAPRSPPDSLHVRWLLLWW